MAGFDPVGSTPVGSIRPTGGLTVIWSVAPTDSDVGQTVSWQASASGGTAAYTYSVSAGALPSGLSLNSATGGIAGTITGDSAAPSFTILATDALGATGVVGASIVVFNPAYATRKVAAQRQQFVITYRKRHKPWRPAPRSTKRWASINVVPLRITWTGSEVANSGAPLVRVTWVGSEVANTGAPLARMTWVGFEVASSIDVATIVPFRRGLAIRFAWDRKRRHRPRARPRFTPIASSSAAPRPPVVCVIC